MDDRHQDLLYQIATDVAVIKTQMSEIAELSKTAVKQEVKITELQTQMNVAKWISGILGAGLVGILVKIFTHI